MNPLVAALIDRAERSTQHEHREPRSASQRQAATSVAGGQEGQVDVRGEQKVPDLMLLLDEAARERAERVAEQRQSVEAL